MLALAHSASKVSAAAETGLGQDLVFMISAPRSGSTLLQHILGSHSDVHTLPEPWLMLPLLYPLRRHGASAEYNAEYAAMAIQDYLKRIDGGQERYFEGARAMANHLYGAALEGSGKHYFLDKTPRYYFVIDEIRHVFPRAKLVLLVRNPLAIFASIVATSFRNNIWRFLEPGRVEDVLLAPKRLAAAMTDATLQTAVVRYESLVQDPPQTVRAMCEAIGLPFEESMIDYGDKTHFPGTPFVDEKSIYKHSRPVLDYADGWKRTLAHPQLNYLARGYLEALGCDTVTALGYDYGALQTELAACVDRTQVKYVCGHIPVSWARLSAHATMSQRERDALGWLGELSTRGVRATVERRVKKAMKNRGTR